jgi:hypothetical protein
MRISISRIPDFMKAITSLGMAVLVSGSGQNIMAQIVRVPSDFQTIAQAIENAQAGDTIILSPGTYSENSITINKPLTISSEWVITGDNAKIEATTVDAMGGILFSITSDDVEISGLTIVNGDHTLDIHARVTIKHNLMFNNLDAVSLESEGGGYVGYNLFDNNADDGIDMDINQNGSDIIIEHNHIVISDDDGIEIRLFDAPNQNIHYEIRYNTIERSNNAALQIISYDLYTGKEFNIHHNIFKNCKTGLGCMDGSNTSEDLSGALYMDERVYFYNNTMLENDMGATGGNNIIAINNIVVGNTIGGFKRFGKNSVIANNLFYDNMDHNFIEIDNLAEQYDNMLSDDPLLDEITLMPGNESPAIDAGLDKFIMEEITVIEITSDFYAGSAPDLGAVESIGENTAVSDINVSDNDPIRNYPNPFKGSTTISVNIPQTDYIKIDIYDTMGRNLYTLEEGFREKGGHTFEWFAKDEYGHQLPGGIYFARIRTGNIISNAKMLLLQ